MLRWSPRTVYFLVCVLLLSVGFFYLPSLLGGAGDELSSRGAPRAAVGRLHKPPPLAQPAAPPQVDRSLGVGGGGGDFADFDNRDEEAARPVAVVTGRAEAGDGGEAAAAEDGLTPIDCVIDGERRVGCVRGDEEVFVPFFGFLRQHLDVSGRLVRGGDGQDRLEWWQSYAKVHPMIAAYDARGPFGFFHTYNVEARERVRCISGEHGVPMSVQWSPQPYYYPIQIAQYGLEHYSKNLSVAARPSSVVMANNWQIPHDYKQTSQVNVRYDDELKDDVVEFKSDASLDNPGIFLQLDSQPMHTLVFSLQLAEGASFSVSVEMTDTKEFVHLHYTQTAEPNCIATLKPNVFRYSLGPSTERRRLARNIATDLNRALSFAGQPQTKRRKADNKHKLAPDSLRLVILAVRGQATLTGKVTQTTSAHRQHFLDAADWLLASQDGQGGWQVPVARSLADGRLRLAPGWHSAMAQGHAMSLLARAFAATADRRYLLAARRAVDLFAVDASDGGVRNVLFGAYPWFEEYPTTPGSFVLNGFMYSLLGLHDLSSLDVANSTARQLYVQGRRSLFAVLPLFDTGSGSVYDLRHVSLPEQAPNLARWDYHAVHIQLLQWLHSIDPDEQLKATADRWSAYALGHRARHN